MKSTKAKPKSQSDKFRETARKLECDESEERFDAALKKVGGALPAKAKPSKAKKTAR